MINLKNISKEKKSTDLLPLSTISGSPTLILSEKFAGKIKHLCLNINDTEWSGFFWWKVLEGTPENLDTFKVEAVDLLLMSIDDPALTIAHSGPAMMDFQLENPELLQMPYGVIHSHHGLSLGANFSGTDIADLKENTSSHNIYISTIVTNKRGICAKLAFISEVTQTGVSLDSFGTPFTINKTSKRVLACDMVVKTPACYSILDKRIQELEAKNLPAQISNSPFQLQLQTEVFNPNPELFAPQLEISPNDAMEFLKYWLEIEEHDILTQSLKEKAFALSTSENEVVGLQMAIEEFFSVKHFEKYSGLNSLFEKLKMILTSFKQKVGEPFIKIINDATGTI